MTASKKKPNITLPTWDVNKDKEGEDITLTTEEIELLGNHTHVFYTGTRRCTTEWCAVTVKDGRRIIVRMERDAAHKILKDAGGRLRAEKKD